MVQVNKFGIHYDHKLNCNWLLQRTGGSSVIGLPSDFCKITTVAKDCPHQINLSEIPNWKLTDKNIYTKKLSKLDITKFLLPIPNKNPYKKPIVYVECKSLLEEQCILYLSSISLTYGNTFKFYKAAPAIKEILHSSNISRVIMASIDESASQALLNHLLKIYLPSEGRLLIAGKKIPQYEYQLGVQFIPFPDKLLHIIKDMEDLNLVKEAGILELRRYMKDNVEHDPEEGS